MTELFEEPLFKVGAYISNYIETNKRGNPDTALIDERSHDYLENLLEKSEDGTVSLRNNGNVKIRVYRIEELSTRKRKKLKAINGIPFYLCQTGIFGRIKVKSICPYNLKEATYHVSWQ